MVYDVQIQNAIDTIVDCCAYHEGKNCGCCEAIKLCCCKKPIDILLEKTDTDEEKLIHH